MDENRRDAGLVRSVGPVGLAASIASIMIGAGIFAAPGALAASMGAYAPLAFVVCGLAMGAIAICFAEGGSRIATSGGIYGYVTMALGPLTGYVVGTLLWLSDLLAQGAVAAALGDVAASVAPAAYRTAVYAAVIVCVIGGIAVYHLGGVGRGTRLVKLTTVLKLLPLAIFVMVGATAMQRANFVQTTPLSSLNLGRAVILAFFLLTGAEVALNMSGEVRQPSRTIPRALVFSLGPVVLLYVLLQLIAQGILGASLAQSAVPLADAMAHINPGLRALMLAAAALSMFGWITSDILATPRVLFALARDGLMPRVLGRLHPRTHTPYVAILCYAAVAMGLALTGSFAELAVLATLAVAPLYIGGCVAAWRLQRAGVALAGEPLNFRWLGVAMVVGVVSMVGLVALAARTEILGLFAVVGASVAVYLVQTRVGRMRAAAASAGD